MTAPQQPLPRYKTPARFADGLFAWWLLRRAATDPARPSRGERDNAVHRWEGEGGSIEEK